MINTILRVFFNCLVIPVLTYYETKNFKKKVKELKKNVYENE